MSAAHHHDHGLDAYAKMKSPIHAWEMRLKIASLLALIFAIALIDTLWLLPVSILITLILYAVSRLPFSFLRSRLAVPGYFIIALVIFLPFVAGTETIAEWGFVSIKKEGLEQAVLIVGRFFCIFTLGLILFSTNTFLNTIRALRGLKFPDIMADMVLLTFRYLFQIGELFQTIRTAARLRGFRPTHFSRATLTTFASLTGHLIIRSYDQAEQVYKAMILRGYGLDGVKLHHEQPVTADWIKTTLTLITAIALLITTVLL